MTGHVTKLPKGYKLKPKDKITDTGGSSYRIEFKPYFPNASAAIKAKKSKRARPIRRTV